MKISISPAMLLVAACSAAFSQEVASKWNVEIPAPIVRAAPAEEQGEPVAVDFDVLASRTKQVQVSQTPEMPDLPPITGKMKMTIQKVADPGLTDPQPPLEALPPTDPAVLSRLETLRQTYGGLKLVFLSATVYSEIEGAQEARTLLKIYPNGQKDKEVVAWSNVNFMHLVGQGGYRVNHDDGTFQDIGLLLGISPIHGETLRRLAEKAGREYQAPQIPSLPDLAVAGPAFVLVEGDSDSPAMATLEQLHELFRKSAGTLKNQYLEREKAIAERKAYLLAHPPKPEDVTVRVWKRTPVETQKDQ